MAKKTLGYVELEWECPSCGTRNPGSSRTCAQCGTAQPEATAFEQAAEEEIISDQAKIAEAAAGPDVHCGYCGTRNPATRTTCKQCGADLAEGKARASGQVIGALREEPAPPVACPSCGASNPATALKCAQCGESLARPQPAAPEPQPSGRPKGCGRWLIVGLVGIVALLALFLFLSTRTSEVIGDVRDIQWRRTIAIQALVPVTREGWRDELPSGVEVGSCRKRLHHTEDQPVAGATEVCGTPYVIDKGSGFGEVVQDCRYQVYADWCAYQTMGWVAAPPLVLEGRNSSPAWPALLLAENQRPAGRHEQFVVVFDADGRNYSYNPATEMEFSQYLPGSRWRLQVNAFGTVIKAMPR